MEPIRITLPWSVLVPDNAKSGVMNGRILLTSRYRTAKARAHLLALAQTRSARQGPFPADCALAVVLHPPTKRRPDVTNYCKLIHDALQGVAYLDDAQLADVRYVRGAIDRVNPRAELTITPQSQTPHPPREGQENR